MALGSRVFVVQEPLRRTEDGSVQPRFSLEDLAQYGEIVMVLGWSDMRPPVHEQSVMRKIADCFQRHGGLTPQDYIVPTGHPAAIAMVALVAYDMTSGSEVRMLVWDGKFKKYDAIRLNLEYVNA